MHFSLSPSDGHGGYTLRGTRYRAPEGPFHAEAARTPVGFWGSLANVKNVHPVQVAFGKFIRILAMGAPFHLTGKKEREASRGKPQQRARRNFFLSNIGAQTGRMAILNDGKQGDV